MITLLTILGYIAWTGGILLFFQLVLLVFGFDGHTADVSTDVDIDTDIHAGDTDAGDSGTDGHDSGVKLFSLLGLASFLFMFPIVTRLCILSLSLHVGIALLIGTAVGILMMYLVGWLFYKAKSIESDGTTKIKDTLECSGTVYLPFKNTEIGTVHVDVNGILREYDAIAENGTEFKVGDSIKVSSIQGNFLKVRKNN